jgi:hypothetical protein
MRFTALVAVVLLQCFLCTAAAVSKLTVYNYEELAANLFRLFKSTIQRLDPD